MHAFAGGGLRLKSNLVYFGCLETAKTTIVIAHIRFLFSLFYILYDCVLCFFLYFRIITFIFVFNNPASGCKDVI